VRDLSEALVGFFELGICNWPAALISGVEAA
jgi:hypothetical protein